MWTVISLIQSYNSHPFFLTHTYTHYSVQVGAYVLNFNGRVTMASVKNFQLVDPDEQNAVVLQVCSISSV